jgi:hypothetical protein
MKKFIQKTSVFFILQLSLITTSVFSQQSVWKPFSILWQTNYGGTNIERDDYMGKTIAPANDGGYLTVANTWSSELLGYHGNGDILATKLTSNGTIVWQKIYGGSAHDELHSIINTSDGGFLIMATSSSNDGDVNAHNHGNDDVWLLKIDMNGNKQWSKLYGGNQQEIYVTGMQNADGTYMITATTASNNGDVHGNHGGYDGWLLKINTNGTLAWQKCYGGSKDEWVDGLAIINALGGGHFLSFNAYSQDGQLANAGFHTGFDEFQGDAWLIKIDEDGNIQWSKCYGGIGDDWFRYINQFSNGDIISTGFTLGSDNTGDMPGTHGDYDWWVMRISSTGNVIWSRQYGGTRQEAIHNQAFEYPNGEILLPSGTNSNDGDVVGNTAGKALWIMKTDPDGNILGYNLIGDVGYNQFAGGILNSDGSLVINGMVDPTNTAGFSETVDENANVWTLKLIPTPLTKHEAQFYSAANGKTGDICTNKPSAKIDLRVTVPSGYISSAGITVQYFKNNNLISQTNMGGTGFTGAEGQSFYSNLTILNSSYGDGTYKAKISYNFSPTANNNFSNKNFQSNNVNLSFNCGASVTNTKRIEEIGVPENRLSSKVFPNPFARSTTISFSIPKEGKVALKIYDLTGALIDVLTNEEMQSGVHELKWDASDVKGKLVPAGTYLLKIQVGKYSETKKLFVIK